MTKSILLILLAIPFATQANMLEGAFVPADEDEATTATTSTSSLPDEIGVVAHSTPHMTTQKVQCELKFKKPEYVGGVDNTRLIRFDVSAKGKKVFSGSREVKEKEIYNVVEDIAREKLPSLSSLNQKEVIEKYLESACKFVDAEPGTTDHAFELLACMSKVYEKKLHEDVRKDVTKKLAMCK